MRNLLLLTAVLAAPALAQIQAEIPPPSQSAQGDVSVTIYNNDLALVQDTRQIALPAGRSRAGIPRRLGPDPPGDRHLHRRRLLDRRAEFRFRSALAAGADAEGGRRDDHPGPGQPRHRRRNARAGAGARRQWRRRAPDRRTDRGAARRRPAGPGDLRSGAGKSARPADLVGNGRKPARRPPAGDSHLSDAGPRLGRRLCRLVRRSGGPDGRPGLDYAD